MNTPLIYVIGCIISYMIIRLYRYYYKENSWEMVILSILIGICSFTGIILFLLIFDYDKLNKKPPKWL